MTQQSTSHSREEVFAQCGKKAYLQYVQKVPQRPSIAAVAGRAFHRATETIDRELLATG